MDKQKQIEEMAKIILEASCKGSECANCEFVKRVEEAKTTCLCLKSLYNAGYRKIPEGAVVLTEEESVKAWENGNCNAHAIYGLAYEQARKETAEKFAEMLKEKAHWFLIGEIQRDHFCECLDEICKEITEKGVQNGD